MPLSKERKALLLQKSTEYVGSIEAAGQGINYTRVATDSLLLLEAINDWSGRALGEGGEIRFACGGDDPCCATEEELVFMVQKLHRTPMLIYPVSGFLLTKADDLQFSNQSSFRMRPHTSESRSDGIGIAETKHIRDIEAAIQLWAFAATEDCMAYLYAQMNLHGLYLEEEECLAARRIITSALLDRFSVGQVWNAMWRSVKEGAALSTRQYFNNEKAAKTIPKKIDKVLALQSANPSAFESYERVADRPMGAVLTLFLRRFGISDDCSGLDVRAKLAADAALAQPEEVESEYDPGRGLIQGTFYYVSEFTDLDRAIISSFKGLQLDSPEPEWDEEYPVFGSLGYSMTDIYCFDGPAFVKKLLVLLGVPWPTDEDFARNAAFAAEERAKNQPRRWSDESGWSYAIEEALVNGGVTPATAWQVVMIARFPSEPDEIVPVARNLPVPSGLVAMRVDFAHVYPDYLEHGATLAVGQYAFSLKEVGMEPMGSDRDLVASLVTNHFEAAAALVGTGLASAVRCKDKAGRAQMLRLVAAHLIAEADDLCPAAAAPEPVTSDGLPSGNTGVLH